MTRTVQPDFGFTVLCDFERLRHRLLSRGPDGLISFAKALIWSGWTKTEEIVSEICLLAGDHLEGRVRRILLEEENVHWKRDPAGEFSLLSGEG